MSEFLTPSGLAERLVKKAGVSPETAKQFAAVFFKIVKNGLKERESFSVYNFGTFKKTWIETAQGVNPATGEKIEIPAHWRIKFVPCAAVARRINRPYAHLKPKVVSDDGAQKPAAQPVPQSAPSIAAEPEEYDNEIESEDEFNDEYDKETDGRPLKLLVIVGAVLLALILLISLLVRGCAAKRPAADRQPPRAGEGSAGTIGAVEADGSDASDSGGADVPADGLPESGGGNAEMQPDDAGSEPDGSGQSAETPDEEEAAAALFRDYTIPAGSSYHAIAAEEYGDRHLWPYLYAANKARNPDPDAISARDVIQIPELPPESERRQQLSAAVLDAYNAYLLMTEKQPDSPRNEERRRRAVRALVSGEILNPGFIDEYKARILPDYAEAARNIALHQYTN